MCDKLDRLGHGKARTKRRLCVTHHCNIGNSHAHFECALVSTRLARRNEARATIEPDNDDIVILQQLVACSLARGQLLKQLVWVRDHQRASFKQVDSVQFLLVVLVREQQKLAKLDIVRLLLLALKGTAVEQANRADDAMTSAMASIDPMHMCSTNAQCTDQVRLSGERFDRVDGQVANAVRKQYIIHFAPDTGYALSLSSIVNEGTALVRVASSTGDLLLQHAGVRIAEKRIVAGQLASEFADAQHRVTLQHCDGYGDYRVELVGEREPTPPTQWESPSNDSAVRDFWLANGAPPEMDKSLYSLGVQYVPYPQFAGDARATLVESSDGGQLAIAVPIGTSVARYHVFLVSREAPAVATVCDVFRAGGRLVATAVASNRSVAQFEPPVVDSRAYVVAESDNGAMTLLCPSDSPMGLEIAVRNSGVAAAVGATLGVLAVVLVVVAIVVFLVKKGKIRAPSFV